MFDLHVLDSSLILTSSLKAVVWTNKDRDAKTRMSPELQIISVIPVIQDKATWRQTGKTKEQGRAGGERPV